MNDQILISDLLIRGIVGINESERTKRQDIVLNLRVTRDLRAAARSDRVDDTLNYRTLTKAIVRYVEGSSHFLVEALADRIARIAVVDFGAERVRVRIEKPGALRFARSVGVEIERVPGDFD